MLASVFTLLALITHLISVTVLYFTQPVKVTVDLRHEHHLDFPAGQIINKRY